MYLVYRLCLGVEHALQSLSWWLPALPSLACHRVVVLHLATLISHWAQAISDLIDDCLQQHPEQRPTAEQLFTRLQAS